MVLTRKPLISLSIVLLCLLWGLSFSLYANENPLSRSEYKRIQQVQSLQIEARWQEARKVTRKYLEAEPRPLLSAMLWRSLAQIELQEARYKAALPALKKAWQLKQLPEKEQLSLQGIMAQLMLQQDELKQGIPLFEAWLDQTPKDKHQARHYLSLAQAYSQLEKWSKALPHVKKAISLSDKVPTNWYQMQVGLHSRLKQWPQAVSVQRVVVARKANQMASWRQLALLQYQVNHKGKPHHQNKTRHKHHKKKRREVSEAALATLRIAYERQLFEKISDYQLLSQWLSVNNLPYQAAQVLEEGVMTQSQYKAPNKVFLKQQRRLAQLWIRAKALPKAEAVLQQLATIQPDPKLLQQLAQLQIRQQQWQKAESSLKQLLALSPKNYGDILLLHGITLLQLEERIKASEQFQLALKEDSSQQGAKQWLNYIAATEHSS